MIMPFITEDAYPFDWAEFNLPLDAQGISMLHANLEDAIGRKVEDLQNWFFDACADLSDEERFKL